MVKSRPNDRNLFRKLILESLQDRRLMAVDLAAPFAANDDHFCDSAEAMTEQASSVLLLQAGGESQAGAAVQTKAVSTLQHFQSETDAFESLKLMAVERWNDQFGKSWNYLHQRYVEGAFDRMLASSDGSYLPIAQNLSLEAGTRNVQTVGVDEADDELFSNDGYVFVSRNQEIRVIDIRDPKVLKEASRIELPDMTASMHLVGDQLVVISQGYDANAVLSFSQPNFFTRVKLFDVSNKENPVSMGGFHIDGNTVVSRIVDGKLVLVQNTRQAIPELQIVNAHSGAFTSWASRFETKQEYLDRISTTLLDSMLVHYQQVGADGKVVSEGALGDWRDIANAGGSQLTSVVAMDLSLETPRLHSMESILGGWVENTYVTENSVYLTHIQSEGITRITQLDLGNGTTKADTTSQRGLTARAFGDVPGTVRNSRFMDEYDGHLRVVTSVDGSNSGGRVRNSANVFVMKQAGGELKQVGSLLDISPGDQAFSAEFEGGRAFITTGFVDPAMFRVIDPLHGIDLSDPTQPTELSDVVIPGLTNYVQWVDPNHLLGIGMVEEQSQWYMQVSLYEVADLADPKTVDVWRSETPIQPNFFGSVNALDIHYDAQSKTLTIPQTQTPNQFFPPDWGLGRSISDFAMPWVIDRIMPIWNPNGAQDGRTNDVFVFDINLKAADPLSLRAEVGDGSGMGRAVVMGETLVAVTNTYLSTYSIDEPTKVVDRILLSNPLRPDTFYIANGAPTTIIDVLGNDFRLQNFEITAIRQAEITGLYQGTMKILPDQTLQYTSPVLPTTERSWWDNFVYEVTTADGDKFETQVSIWGEYSQPAQGTATVSARAIDAQNRPVIEVAKGDEFWVEVLVQDGDSNGLGVFSAFLNLAFDTNSFEVIGDAERLGHYTNGTSGELTESGWSNLGGFSDLPTPIGPGKQPLVRFKVRAIDDAAFRMTISPSNTVGSEFLFYGIDTPIPVTNIAFESLELPQRVDASASIALKAYDLENKPITSTRQGDEFWIEVLVQDGRTDGQGVYSAYVDLAFDTSAFEIVEQAEAMGSFTNKLSGEKTSNGWKNLGGFRDSVIPAGSAAQSLVRFKLRATEDAVLNLTVTPSAQLGYELSLYGVDTIIPPANISATSLQLTRAVFDYDVNADGILSPIDSLIVINHLNRESAQADSSAPILASSNDDKLDVNQDGIISLLDVLALINRINRENMSPAVKVDTMMNTIDSNDSTKKK